MSKKLMRLTGLILGLIFCLGLVFGCGNSKQNTTTTASSKTAQIAAGGQYTSKHDVALYVHTYKKLPANFITKKEAQRLGWKQKGTLDKVAPGKSIGGDKFGNFGKKLPTKGGRHYTECDINYKKGNRGPERIVFSNDGLIFYCKDHYNTFEQLY